MNLADSNVDGNKKKKSPEKYELQLLVTKQCNLATTFFFKVQKVVPVLLPLSSSKSHVSRNFTRLISLLWDSVIPGRVCDSAAIDLLFTYICHTYSYLKLGLSPEHIKFLKFLNWITLQ